MASDAETLACKCEPVDPAGFNGRAALEYGCTVAHIRRAMAEFTDFLTFVNKQLHGRRIPRLESMLMPANFSSMVGEFMVSNIPKYCSALVKNAYHNGHPDLLPAGRFAGDAVRFSSDGIEVKASRYLRGWQGHNPESCFLLVFVFDGNRPSDEAKGRAPRPFRFLLVAGARLVKSDWLFSGRSETSRRTITASVTPTGYQKMMNNWIYRAAELREE